MLGAGVQSLVRELDPTCLQLKILHATTKSSHAAAKIWHSQVNKFMNK